MQKKKSPILDLNKDRLVFRILGFAFTFALLILVFSFTTFQKQKPEQKPIIGDGPVIIDIPLVKEEEKKEPQKPEPPLAKSKIEIVEDDKNFTEPDLDKLFEDLKVTNIPIDIGPNESIPKIEDEPIIDPNSLEVQIRFNGGDEAFSQFISDNLIYPSYQEAEGIEGVVWVNFIVDKDGNITEVNTEGSAELEFIAEAKRVIKLSSGMWLPAEYRKKRVKSRVKMSIAFEIK